MGVIDVEDLQKFGDALQTQTIESKKKSQKHLVHSFFYLRKIRNKCYYRINRIIHIFFSFLLKFYMLFLSVFYTKKHIKKRINHSFPPTHIHTKKRPLVYIPHDTHLQESVKTFGNTTIIIRRRVPTSPQSLTQYLHFSSSKAAHCFYFKQKQAQENPRIYEPRVSIWDVPVQSFQSNNQKKLENKHSQKK